MMIRKILAGLALACVLSAVPAAAQPAAIQTELTFYRNSGTHLPGVPTGTAWAWPGTALSSSVQVIRADMVTPADLFYARLLLVWTPGSTVCATGVRLVSAESGPVNIQPVAGGTFEATGATPIVSAFNITAALRDLIISFDPAVLMLGMQTHGACGVAPKIYSFLIEMVWTAGGTDYTAQIDALDARIAALEAAGPPVTGPLTEAQIEQVLDVGAARLAGE